MIIRLLQQFSSISLDMDALPAECHPRPEWKQGGGRRAIEKTWPKAHLTMYAAVSFGYFEPRPLVNNSYPFSQGGLWVKMEEAENNA
jgi:hypothetical protein